MKRLVVALAIVVAPVVGAQRPDFSGTWLRVVDSAVARPSVAAVGDASFRTGDMGSGWGSPLTITQRADSLIAEYVFFGTYDLQPPIRLAFALDGSGSVNTVMIGHATSVQRSRAGFDGSSLVIATGMPVPPGVQGSADVGSSNRSDHYIVMFVLQLESPTSLVIDTRRMAPPTRNSPTLRTTYTRRAP